MREKIIFLYLLLGTYQDMNTKTIKNWYLWLGGVLGLSYKFADILSDNFYLYQWILSLLPGIMLFVCSKIGKESIGNGDGWIMLVLGTCYPKLQVWSVFYLSMVLVMIMALILFCIKRKETEIPYLPFLCLSDLILWRVQYVY